MEQPFLTAEWRNLLMANYEIEPLILKKYLPCYTELDDYNGKYYVSLVGFLFKDTRVNGISFPFHKTFEEVNLRFYVRYKQNGEWKRGVVFIKEIVPRRIISLIANTIYKENYATHIMKHNWHYTEEQLTVEYYWKLKTGWNYIKATADSDPTGLIKDSEEEFITEHFWGYTFINIPAQENMKYNIPVGAFTRLESIVLNVMPEIYLTKNSAKPLSMNHHQFFLQKDRR